MNGDAREAPKNKIKFKKPSLLTFAGKTPSFAKEKSHLLIIIVIFFFHLSAKFALIFNPRDF